MISSDIWEHHWGHQQQSEDHPGSVATFSEQRMDAIGIPGGAAGNVQKETPNHSRHTGRHIGNGGCGRDIEVNSVFHYVYLMAREWKETETLLEDSSVLTS